MRKGTGKEPFRERTIGLTLVFDSVSEKDAYLSLMTQEGRKPAAYVKFLLHERLQENRRKRQVIGEPLSAFRF